MNFFTKLNPFQKKSFALPLLSPKPLVTVINGQIRFFDKIYSNDALSLWLIEKYNTLSEVSAPINKIAEFASVVEPELYENGEYLEDTDPIYQLLEMPNKYQNWQEYYKKHFIYRILLGNSYNNAYGYFSPNLKFELKLLPPQYTKINLRDKRDFRNLEIKNYTVKVPSFDEIIIEDIENVLHIKNTSANFTQEADLYGYPKLASCIKNIESIESGYGAKVGLYTHGPKLIITGKQIGEFAAAYANTGESVDELQQRINTAYGLQPGQNSVLITDKPLDVSSVSMNMQQLQINENNISDFQSICRALDIDSRVLSDVSSSTFSNVEMAFESFLNGSFKIAIENDYAQWGAWLSYLFKRNIEMKPNFEHIPAIVKKENEGNDKLIQLAKDGFITRNEVLERIGEELSPDIEYDKYYSFFNGTWNKVSNEIDIEQNNEEDGTDEDEQDIQEPNQ